jgi:hypothetical protein
MPTSYEASTQIIIAINLRAALTSNSGNANKILSKEEKRQEGE